MANFTRTNNKMPQTLSIDNFKGINLFSPIIGESTNMKNFKVTPDLKLKKRDGTKLLTEFSDVIRGTWYGKLIDDEYALYVCAGTQIIKYIIETGSKAVLGNISSQSSGHVNIFYAYSRLYFCDGYDVYTYDGSLFASVDVYIPVRQRDMAATGNSFIYHEMPNLLTNKYKCRFKVTSLGVLTYVHNFPIAGVEKVLLNDVDYTSSFTVTIDSSSHYGTLTYTGSSMPATGTLEVTYISYTDSQRHEIFSNRYHAIFGEYSLPRLFFYGGNKKNKIYYTEKFDDNNGLYIIEGNSFNVGEEKNAVTSVIRQFDDLMIFTEGDAWSISSPDIEKNSLYINYHYTYSLTMISSSTGNIGFGNVKSIDNNLISVTSDGLYSWSITKIFDERNVKFVSDKLYKGMSDEFISNAVTFHNRIDGEIWLTYNGEVWIYNFKLDVWYYYDNIYANGLFTINDIAFYYDNRIFIFDENCYTDSGKPIEAIWESNYMDFDLPQYTKNINRIYLTVKDICSIDNVKIKSDRNTEVRFNKLINDTDTPMTFTRRMNITRCKFIRLSIVHDSSDNRPTIMNIKFAWVQGGEGR